MPRICAFAALVALPNDACIAGAWELAATSATVLAQEEDGATAHQIRLIAVEPVGSGIGVTFEAVQGWTYRLDRKPSITDTSWQSIPGVSDQTAPANGPLQLVDPNALSLGRAFYRVQYLPLLSVIKTGLGAGTVTSSPAGISCGSDCSEPFTSGTSVSLTAVAAAGSAFNGWANACLGSGVCGVVMDGAKTVGADFLLLNTNPPCSSNQFLGTISGDTGGGTLNTSGVGEKWLRVRITENSSSTVYLSSRLVLNSPAGNDYDLHVYCLNCGGTPAGSSSTTGTEVVDVRRNDSFGGDDSFEVLIEIRYFSGSTTAQWTLSASGNVVVNAATCGP